jgi:hypothetical protein
MVLFVVEFVLVNSGVPIVLAHGFNYMRTVIYLTSSCPFTETWDSPKPLCGAVIPVYCDPFRFYLLGSVACPDTELISELINFLFSDTVATT